MHHVSIILTLTFIQSHTDLNHKNNKCLIISETIQAMPTKFAVKTVQLNVYRTIASPMTLTFIQGQAHLKFDNFFKLQYLGQHRSYYIQTWHDGRLKVDA